MVYCNSGINLCSVTPVHRAILNHWGSVSFTVYVSVQQFFHRNVSCDLGFLDAVLCTKKINETIFSAENTLFLLFCMPVKHRDALRHTAYFIHRWRKLRGYTYIFKVAETTKPNLHRTKNKSSITQQRRLETCTHTYTPTVLMKLKQKKKYCFVMQMHHFKIEKIKWCHSS